MQIKSRSNLILLGYIHFIRVELEGLADNRHCL